MAKTKLAAVSDESNENANLENVQENEGGDCKTIFG